MSILATLPTGTVTFLFTDIEGSTKLWEQHPEAMRPALARHDNLLRQSIEDNGGFVFKTVGDAFCSAFPSANQALEAALAAQLALAAEVWELPTPLLVRMALHTGISEERSGDYFGPPLNRVARLMSAGHGGQTLLSGTTQELTQDQLPDGTTLRDLGERRLKDLGRPEHVYQADHSSLAADFPPLRSLDNPDLPNNLPQQATSFIGREKQVEEVKSLLIKTHLLTLTGAGGNGKTRLSLQVAADLLDRYFDGVWLVELAALADPVLVPQVVAQVLDVREEAGKPIQQTLVEALKSKRLLIVLDNCEHLVAACASLAADLLKTCQDIHILASSREPLNVSGEQTYRVPSLSMPDPKKPQAVGSLLQFEAVRLFIERAQAVQPLFALINANASAVAQVCWRLDGIPLAIELAAARVRSLSVDEISTRLDNRFRLLTGGARNTLPRQQTLRALIDWSYDLLTTPEKTVLCRLSVFVGGWSLQSAERVCSGDSIEDCETLDLLTSLVDKSLVVYEEEEGNAGRYRLPETVRQYARDRLVENGGVEDASGVAAAWFLALAEDAEPQLTGPEQASWLECLETEHDNLRATLSWYEQQTEGADANLRLTGALWRFWSVRGHYFEGRQWLGQALNRTQQGKAGQEVSAARAKALNGLGNLVLVLGDYTAAQALYEESLLIQRQLGDQRGMSAVLNNLGIIATGQGDYVAAQALHQESLAIRRQLGDQEGIASSLNNLGTVYMQVDYVSARRFYEESLVTRRRLGNQRGIAESLNSLGLIAAWQGEYTSARALHEESLTIQRQLGDQRGIAISFSHLGLISKEQGDSAGARTWYEESLSIFRRLGDQEGIAVSLDSLGNVSSAEGKYVSARTLFEESLTIRQRLGDQEGIAYSLEGLAGMAYGQNSPRQAAKLLGITSFLRETLGSRPTPAEQEAINKLLASGRAALGEEAFAAAWDEGRAMTMEQAIEYALAEHNA